MQVRPALLIVFALVIQVCRPALAESLRTSAQKAVRAATFEVVARKVETDPVRYEKDLPMDLLPYAVRSDPIGRAS